MKIFLVATFLFCTTSLWSQQSSYTISKLTATQIRHLIDTSTVPTIFNFWASWCGPCIREIPYFEEQVKRTPIRLVLVSIDYPDAYSKTLKDFVQKKGYTSEVIFLDETDPEVFVPIIEKQWSGAIPASIFVDNSKKFYRFFNSQLTEQRLALELRALLKTD